MTRRDLFRTCGALGGALALPRRARSEPAVGVQSLPADGGSRLRLGPDIYQSIGVRPLVNARGTYTILSGSTMLPEVRAAMDWAARHHVHLEELAEAIGARLAALTGAEWGLVSSGCAAALTHATAACVAGGNPDLHVRIPDLRNFQKDEAIIPKHSRNVYDAAVRAVGVRVVEVETVAELESALGPRTALVYILAGPQADEGPLHTKAIASMANARGVPILVDAAAEILTVPNVHLAAGATLVAYSGGKCIRGPQTAGLLLGRADLVRAAWVHSAPHHGFARGMKVGKEEAIGMLMAVEMWLKRDHDAEWKLWTSWLEHVRKTLATIDGVTTAMGQPRSLSNRTPSLSVFWNRKRLGIGGELAVRRLFDGSPRISVSTARSPDPSLTGITVRPYMLEPGEERLVGERLRALLLSPEPQPETALDPPAADVSGPWDVRIRYAAGASRHVLQLRQDGNQIDGSHQGDFVTRDVFGTIEGPTVRLRSTLPETAGDALSYSFAGDLQDAEIRGTLDLGEYLGAAFIASRRRTR